MKLKGSPQGLYNQTEILACLGFNSPQAFNQSGLKCLLDWYKVGSNGRLYTADSVNKLAEWLQARKEKIDRNELPSNAPLMPPRLHRDQQGQDLTPAQDARSRRMFLDAWFDEGEFDDY